MMNNYFSTEDIHAIRSENYNITKEMTHAQLMEHTRKEAEEGLRLLEKLKAKRSHTVKQ